MAINWKDGFLYVELPYWVIRDCGFVSENLTGSLCFDLKCKMLKDGVSQKNVEEIEKIVLSKCEPTIEAFEKKHKLTWKEITNFIANIVWSERIDAETIESDAERKNRLVGNNRDKRRRCLELDDKQIHELMCLTA